MKTAKTVRTRIACFVSIGAATIGLFNCCAIAADWDNSFHESFMNNVTLHPSERFTLTTLGTDVYVGSSVGLIWRYKESDSSWVEIASVTGSINALSAVQDGNGVSWLFVGGSFDHASFGNQDSVANNIVALNLNSGAISKLGTSTAYGTDGPVYALKAVRWWDFNPYYPPQYHGVRCLVGGAFATAGWISSKGISQWAQGGWTLDGWGGFGGALTDSGSVGVLPMVCGLEATVTNAPPYPPYYRLRSDWNGIWMTGRFRGNAGTATNVHIAKVAGPSLTQIYLGRGFQEFECGYGASLSEWYWGRTICQAGGKIYFGGYGNSHVRADGAVLYCGDCEDPDIPETHSGIASVGTSSSLITADCCVWDVHALAAKGNDVYASGHLGNDENNLPIHFGKHSGGAWSPISNPSDHDIYEIGATSAASTANYVYFGGAYCWRYSP